MIAPPALRTSVAGPLMLCLAACGQSLGDASAISETVPARQSATAPVDGETSPAPPVATPDPDVLADACGAGRVEPWIGREATVPVRRAVVAAAEPAMDRWIYPDSMVTQDRRVDRLNVLMEKDTDIILSAECG